MQWANFSDVVVRQNYGLVNYTCDDSAKKVNATYALTVQQNTTMNSTVYDIDKHSQMENLNHLKIIPRNKASANNRT